MIRARKCYPVVHVNFKAVTSMYDCIVRHATSAAENTVQYMLSAQCHTQQGVYKSNQTNFQISRTQCNKNSVDFTRLWLCGHADPVYPMDFTSPYSVLADNCWPASLIPEITAIRFTR